MDVSQYMDDLDKNIGEGTKVPNAPYIPIKMAGILGRGQYQDEEHAMYWMSFWKPCLSFSVTTSLITKSIWYQLDW